MNIEKFNPHTLNLWFIYIYWTKGMLWFRWFSYGSGYKIKNIKKHGLLFSERQHLEGNIFGNWFIGKLKPAK